MEATTSLCVYLSERVPVHFCISHFVCTCICVHANASKWHRLCSRGGTRVFLLWLCHNLITFEKVSLVGAGENRLKQVLVSQHLTAMIDTPGLSQGRFSLLSVAKVRFYFFPYILLVPDSWDAPYNFCWDIPRLPERLGERSHQQAWVRENNTITAILSHRRFSMQPREDIKPS